VVLAEGAGIIRINWTESATQGEVLAGACEELAAGVEDFKRVKAGVVARRPPERRAVSGA
jgi:hypothetical protein